MTVAALIVGNAPGRLWGLTARERILRQLAAGGIGPVVDDAGELANFEGALIINAAYLFELRTLTELARQTNVILRCDRDNGLAAARVAGSEAAGVVEAVADTNATAPGVPEISTAQLAGYNRRLRSFQPPLLEPLRPEKFAALEALLYGNAYKGVTDLVTKWCWPRPARAITAWCARLGIRPNFVTLVGLVLVFVTMLAFRWEDYAIGLACGWIMTLLDTVDGKLARVTVTSSRVGHLLDHGIDLIHPPFWYIAWGLSLGNSTPLAGLEVSNWCVVLAAGYVSGRLIEVSFHTLGGCGIFAWRPFDAWFRLIAARRNPCLIILSVGLIAGHPEWAFVGVCLWTLTSTAVMFARLLYATVLRLRSGPLDSWLAEPARAEREFPRAFRVFSATRGAYL